MRLQLHVGHGKTGSSYLQSWLALNASTLLRRHGVLYPQICPLTGQGDQRARAGQFSMGNGFVLESAFGPAASMRRWWRRLCNQHRCAPSDLGALLFSHEPWTRHLPSKWTQLQELSEVLECDGIDLWLVIRDPLEHAISVYGQMVKRHGFTGSLDEWLVIYDFPDVLLRFLDVVAHSGMRVTLKLEHYGRQRQILVQCLCNWLSLPADGVWIDAHKETVNRSLTDQELALMRMLNRRNPQLSARVGERLVDQLPQLKSTAPKPSSEAISSFVKRWGSSVETLNALLPSSARLELPPICDGALVDPTRSAAGEDAAISLLPDQLECLLDGLMGAQF